MRITIVAIGSRGDVQPYVALGRGLAGRGHDVTLATHQYFEPFVRSYGLAFATLSGDPRALVSGELGMGWIESARNPLRFMYNFAKVGAAIAAPWQAELWQLAQDADGLIFGPLAIICRELAEEAGIPAMMATALPLSPTRSFPALVWPEWLGAGPRRNWLSHYVLAQAVNALAQLPMRRWRRAANMPRYRPRARLAELPVLYSFSPHVVTRPPDWDEHLAVTGYWFLDSPPGWQPPQALLEFLAAGPPPVCVGFGSMANRDPRQVARTVLEALKLAGQRGVLLTGWGAMEGLEPGEQVYVAEAVPHDWLYPRMAAIVTHGGAGTTAAALRSGVPAIVVPYFADQPFWGSRVQALGVGPEPIPRQAMTAELLAERIRTAVGDEGMRRRAAELGTALRAEEGIERAVEAFEAHVARHSASRS